MGLPKKVVVQSGQNDAKVFCVNGDVTIWRRDILVNGLLYVYLDSHL